LDVIVSGRVVIETSPGDDCIQCQIPVLLAFRVHVHIALQVLLLGSSMWLVHKWEFVT